MMTYGYHANTTLYDQSRTLTDGSVCFIINLHTGVQVVVRGIILITVNKRTLLLPPLNKGGFSYDPTKIRVLLGVEPS